MTTPDTPQENPAMTERREAIAAPATEEQIGWSQTVSRLTRERDEALDERDALRAKLETAERDKALAADAINRLRAGEKFDAIVAAQTVASATAGLLQENAALRAKLEALLAKAKTTQVRCARCHGSGTHAYFGEAVTCGDCGGSGFHPIETAAELRALLDAPKGRGE